MRCCVLLSRAHASLCVSPLTLEQRNAQGAWRLICHSYRWTKLDVSDTVRQTTHIERRRSCVCSQRCSVRLRGARGTSRYRRPTLAPDKDQRRGATDAFVAWLSAYPEIGRTDAGRTAIVAIPIDPRGRMPRPPSRIEVGQGCRSGRHLASRAAFPEDDCAVRDAMARCEAIGSKVVTDGGQAKERFDMSPMHGLTNMPADGTPMPCAEGRRV